MEHVVMIIFDKTQPAVCNMYFSEKNKKQYALLILIKLTNCTYFKMVVILTEHPELMWWSII